MAFLLTTGQQLSRYLQEAAFYDFFANNAPQPEETRFLLAFHPDMAVIRVKDLEGRDFPVVLEAKTLGIVYGHGFCTPKFKQHFSCSAFIYARFHEPV